jgi:hypothetical protein
MDIKRKLLGATLSATVALTFASAPITLALAAQNEIKCYGVNSCKGHSDCKTTTHACKGQNSCKGQGFLKETKQQCEKMGGSLTETGLPSTPTAAPGGNMMNPNQTPSASGMGSSQ